MISAHRVVFTSLAVDFLDIVVNLTVTIVTGSIVMGAELIQGISDLIASIALLIGLRRPCQETYFWTFLSAMVMLLIASSLSFYFGVQRFLNPQPIENILVAYVALSISVVSNGYAFWLSAKRILGRTRNSKKIIEKFERSSLMMTRNTFVLDLMGMSAAIVGLVAVIFYQVFGDIRFDGLGAMAIGIVLGFLSLRLVVNILRMPKRRVAVEGL